MLLFIDGAVRNKFYALKFQYISCYSLSQLTNDYQSITTFQYISCYSLSIMKKYTEVLAQMFQYISCYSLSESKRISFATIIVSIHLMLLFIVNRFSQITPCILVSIHLMLLFIRTIFSIASFFNAVSIHLMLLFIPSTLQHFSHLTFL